MRQVRRRLPLFFLLLLLLLRPGAAHAQQPLPAEEYRQLLLQTADALRAEPPDSDALAARWQTLQAVTRPDGRIVPLDGAAVAARLRGAAGAERAALAAELAAQAAALDSWPPPLLDSEQGAAAANTLASILARAEFQADPEPANPLREWLGNLLIEAALFLEKLVERIFTTPGSRRLAGQLLIWGLTGLSAVALLGLLAYVSRSLLRDFFKPEARRAARAAPGDPLTAGAALSTAETLSATGDYRTAVRFLYLSLLLTLEERGLLRLDRSLTNREYVRSLAARPELAGVLDEVSSVFDRVWYGYQPISAAAYARFAGQIADLRRRRAEGAA